MAGRGAGVIVREEMDRGGDECDQAAAVTEALLDAALRRQRAASAPETHPDFDGEHCIDCEAEIPRARLALQKVRCVDCQTYLEHSKRQYAKD